MTIGVMSIDLYLPDSNSLKAKRQLVHSLKANLRNRFNVAVTQLDSEDKWQKAQLAVVGVEKNRGTINSMLSRIVNFIEGFHQVELVDYQIQLI